MIDSIEYEIHRSSEDPLETCNPELIDCASSRILNPLIRSKYPYDLLLIGQSLKVEFYDVAMFEAELILDNEYNVIRNEIDRIERCYSFQYSFYVIRHEKKKCFEIAR